MKIDPNSTNHITNAMNHLIGSAIEKINTAMPVEVIGVDTKKRMVSLKPMITLLDSQGNGFDYGTMSNIPYARLQAGNYGIIIDPKIGDKGIVVFASRDISNVLAKRSKQIPASRRQYSISDGIYIASLLNDEPETFLRITEEKVEINAKTIMVTGDVTISGNATIGGISFKDHVHPKGHNGNPTGEPKNG